jgi:hypothetical protein
MDQELNNNNSNDDILYEISDRYKKIVNCIQNIYKVQFENLNDLTIESILEKTNSFYNQLEDETLFLLFVNNKLKVFSSKSEKTNNFSQSLFGHEILLKNLFNNQTDINKFLLWDSLLYIYIYLEENNKNREGRIDMLKDRINILKNNISNNVKASILPDNVNNTTTNMVNDIIGSFDDIFSGNENPFENIMKVTTKISEKYYKDIENGDVEIDKLINNISIPGSENKDNNMGDMMKNMMGGMEDTGEMPDMGDMMKNMMGSLGGNSENGESGEMPDMGNMMKNMMGSLGGNSKNGEMPDMGNMMKNMMGSLGGNSGNGEMPDMSGMMGGMGDMMKNMLDKKEEKTTLIDENFSTADVDQGELKEGGNGNMLGGMMNMANKLPDLGKLKGMVGDLKNIKKGDKDGIKNIKNQMDGFLEKSLGVDINKFNDSMKNMVKNIEKKNKDNIEE